MKYPGEVKEIIDALESFKWAKAKDKVGPITSVHMYPGKIAYPDGFYGARFFQLIAYNDNNGTRYDCGRHDELNTRHVVIKDILIFADGSTFIKFDNQVRMWLTQAVEVKPW